MIVCRFAHVDTKPDDARRMCDTLHGTNYLNSKLKFDLARSNTNSSQLVGNKLSAETNRGRSEQSTPLLRDEQSSVEYTPPQQQQQQQQPRQQQQPANQKPAPLIPQANHSTSLSKSVSNHSSDMDSVYLDDPAVIATPGGHSLFRPENHQSSTFTDRNSSSAQFHNRRPENDPMRQDRWRPAHGNMDSTDARSDGMLDHTAYVSSFSCHICLFQPVCTYYEVFFVFAKCCTFA